MGEHALPERTWLLTSAAVRDLVDQVVGRLWPERSARVEALPGGITNANFLVDLGDDMVVVRVPGKGRALLGIDATSEIVAIRIAAAIGVAPELVAHDEATGCLVSRFVAGRPIPPHEVGREPFLSRVAGVLARVHCAGRVGTIFDYFGVIDRYHEHAGRRGVSEPFDFAAARAVVARIATARPFVPSVLGHNDLLNANLLDDGAVRILDWEYAGMTDPYFDLANLAANHAFDADAEAALLHHYFGAVDDERLATLRLMRLVSELREAMWGVLQKAISDLDVDFTAYAEQHAECFGETLAGMALEDLLASAASISPEA